MNCKLGKKNVAVRACNKPAKKNDTKKGGWTKKKTVAAVIIGVSFLALIIFAVMVFVFDLGPIREIKSSEEEAKVVGEISGYKVKFEELRYLVLLFREELDSEMGEYSSLDESGRAEYERRLREKVLEEIKSNYVILSLCDKYGVDTDNKDVRTGVNNMIEKLVKEVGGKKEYRAWLAENNLTDALLRLIYKTEYLESVLLETLTERGDEIKYSENNIYDFISFVMEDESYIKVIHAFYPKENEHTENWDAESRAASALERIKAAQSDEERLSAMVSEIGKAPFVAGYSVTGTDYYITYGQMHDDYEGAAFSLGEYGVSEVLELEEGYYIIMRVPKEGDEVAPRAYEFIDDYRYAVLKKIEDEQSEKIAFIGNDFFDSLALIGIE